MSKDLVQAPHVLVPNPASQDQSDGAPLLSTPFLLLAFFPYLSPIQTGADLQPYAFIASLIFLLLNWRPLPEKAWLIGLAPFAAFFLWALTDRSLFGLRSCIAYLSLFTVTTAAWIVMSSTGGKKLLRRYLQVSTYSWLAVGLVEWLINPAIMAPLIPNLSLDIDRGVTGLATEPSFYGIHCLALMALNFLVNAGNPMIYAALLLQIVFLSKSAITLLLLAILVLYYIIFFAKIRLLIALLSLGMMLYFAIPPILEQNMDVRLVSLFTNILTDPMVTLQFDTSLNGRIGHVQFSILGFFDNLGIPYGFDTFHSYVVQKLPSTDFVWLGALQPEMKIMSGYGTALFELGAFGLVIPAAISGMLWSYFSGRSRRPALLAVFYVNTILFAAIQLSLPLLGICLGALLSSPVVPRTKGH